jgi:hypothetical protein
LQLRWVRLPSGLTLRLLPRLHKMRRRIRCLSNRGVVMLKSSDGSKQLYGRMVVDLRTGKIWGFPTITTDPYPFDALNSKPQTSHPFELGRFAFEDMDK